LVCETFFEVVLTSVVFFPTHPQPIPSRRGLAR
jgi:hypothetical protein